MIRRHIENSVYEALGDFPVVLIIGARQVGKTTLAQSLYSERWKARYHSLDDLSVLEAVSSDPDGFLKNNPPPLILDEIQRAPDLMRAIKVAVDRKRQAGMYLITGSAHPLKMKTVSESLAGRVAIFELEPFSWPELKGRKPSTHMLDLIFSCKGSSDLLSGVPSRKIASAPPSIEEMILKGGYPDPALLKSGASRTRWFDAYRKTYLERDLRELASIDRLPTFGRLLSTVAVRTGTLANQNEISRESGIPYTTLRRYLDLLEVTFQINFLRPFHANIGKRLVKTPKIYYRDTGMACFLAGMETWEAVVRHGLSGRILETWVAAELRKLVNLSSMRVEMMFMRTQSGREVDFILERGKDLVAIEVKPSTSVSRNDLRGLKALLEDLGDKVGCALILYRGDTPLALGDRIAALPIELFFGV